MRRLKDCLPYGPDTIINKIECSNHLLRNYIRKLRESGLKRRSELGPVPGVLRNKLSANLLRLRSAVTGAVKYNKAVTNIPYHEKINNLRTDIHNGPFHVFGDHSKCKSYYCTGPKENGEDVVENMKLCGLWANVMSANNFLACHTDSLLKNGTSNKAESFNSKICKFIGGKRVNFALRGSYNMRAELSVISTNEGEDIHRLIHKKVASNHSQETSHKKSPQ